MENFRNFVYKNQKKFLVILISYLFVTLSIGIVNYPYIDDINRQVTGFTGFGEHYSRYFSEFIAYLFQGSRHLTDTGLTTYLLSAVIMSLTSILILFIFFDGKKVTWMSVLSSVLLGINPWFLEVLSFRFDSPYISLSVLVSIIPFLLYKRRELKYFLLSIVGIFLMCNSYQASSGIYPIMLLSLIYIDLLSDSKFINIAKKLGISILAYAIAMGLYFIEMNFNPQLASRGDNTKIASLSEMPKAVTTNFRVYFSTLFSQSAKVWILLFFILLLFFIFDSLFDTKISKIKTLIFSLIYLVVGSFLSYGVYAFFAEALSDDRPRYAYGFAFFVGLILILLGNKVTKPLFDYTKVIVLSLFLYYISSFSFTYASTLDYQKDEFERQSVILSKDLGNYITQDNNKVYINRLFNDSPTFLNTSRNYPILPALVPSNSNLYWPNVMWFNNLTRLNANFVGVDFNTIDKSTLETLVSNKYYNIYKRENQLYIYMK